MFLNLLIIKRIKIISEKSCFISNHNCELIKKKKRNLISIMICNLHGVR